jgi:hypothetical protein
MSKPLGYFTRYTPGDGTLFDALETEYGSALEKLTRRQKLYLVMAIAADLACQCPEGDASVYQVSHIPLKVHEQLSHDDAEGLIQCLIAQVRGRNYAQPGS